VASREIATSVRDLAVAVPEATPGSIYHRFRRRYGTAAIVPQLIALPLGAALVLWGALSSTAAFLAAMAVTALGVGVVFNRTAATGVDALRQALVARLGDLPANARLVGLCRPENDTFRGKVLTLRLDTDDNVGFLSLDGDRLSIDLEEGRVVLARADIRSISLRRKIEIPLVFWIVIDHYRGDTLERILLCSRWGHSLWQDRRDTLALERELSAWHTADVMYQLGLESR